MSESKPIVFMYSGQGSQYYNMGRVLFEQEPVFRDWMLRLDQAASALIGESLLEKLYDGKRKITEVFDRTLFTHPAIYMVEIAMTQLLLANDIHPDYVMGESLGEFAAATTAGITDWETGLEMVIQQARTIEACCVEGGMLAVLGDISLYTDSIYLRERCELASVLHNSHFVLTGGKDAIGEIAEWLSRKQIMKEPLPVSHAFHSTLLHAAEDSVQRNYSQKKFRQGTVPLISGINGAMLRELPSGYLWQAVRQPIRLARSLGIVEDNGPAVYLDLGPSGGMANLAKRSLRQGSRSESRTIMSRFQQDAANWEILKREPKYKRHKAQQGKEERSMRAYLFPGQGSQHLGMGEGLFDKYPELTAQADRILGYSIKELCLEDPNGVLGNTKYTQPALYVVNTLHYLEMVNDQGPPDIVAGHSLGEYTALYAAGVFDFETGLRLVRHRGELMSEATGGGMAAVIGLSEDKLRQTLMDHGLQQVDIANYNHVTQIVISGPQAQIEQAQQACEKAGARIVIPLKVSGAFHSSMMMAASERFAAFLEEFSFKELQIPVISNVTARPYKQHELKKYLSSQITHSVQWTNTIQYCMGLNVTEYKEVGPGNVLTKLVAAIRKDGTPLIINDEPSEQQEHSSGLSSVEAKALDSDSMGMKLGDAQFKLEYGLNYAYVTGAMYKGIASEQMVVRTGKAGMLGVFGAGGLQIERVETAIRTIQQQLQNGEPYAFNLLHDPEQPEREDKLVDLYVKYKVSVIEASAYMSVNSALVRYRALGLSRNSDGSPAIANRIIAKVSRPEVAESFLSPPPERMINKLLLQGLITAEAAELLREVPMADDISVEADSGGHTDHRSPYTLLPSIIRLRDQFMKVYGYSKRIRVGAAGGIGTPEAALAAYMMGADYIVTGSINHCTVEADTSEPVKDLLQQANIQDMDYAPAGDMFELGAKVQVLKKGGFFSARANKLYELYRNYNSIDQIDAQTRKMIEEKFFHKSFDDVYREVRAYKAPGDIEKAEQNPKHKMALIFKWYFAMSNRAALLGDPVQRLNYQIHCGPALGAFNQWVKGTSLEDWRQRHVDEIGQKLCDETAGLLQRQVLQYAT